MAQPIKKFYGSINLDNLGKAVKSIPSKVKNSEQYGRDFYIEGAQWDDGGISLSVWDKETKETFKVGRLTVSTLDSAPKAKSVDLDPNEDDLPF